MASSNSNKGTMQFVLFCSCLVLIIISSGQVTQAKKQVRQQLRIFPVGQTHVRELGRNSVFTCQLKSQDRTTSYRLKWLDESRNEIQIEMTNGRVYVEMKLYFTPIMLNDAGKYTCQQLKVNPSNGVETIVQEVHVSISVFIRQPLKIFPDGPPNVMELGTNARLTCRLLSQDTTTSYRLKWLDESRNEIQMTNGRPVKCHKEGFQCWRVYAEMNVYDQSRLKLHFTPVMLNDAGKYTCQQLEVNSSNGLETIVREAHVNISVFKRITFDDCVSPQYPVIHRKATIRCLVSGSPTPTVYWTFKGQRISSQTHPRYTQVNIGLEISNVTNDDEGVFICVAQVVEKGDIDYREIHVQVHTLPKIITRIGDSSGVVEGVAGKDVDIRCIATGKPQPKVEFYKDGSYYPLETDGTRLKVDEAVGTIHFHPLVMTDRGMYTCRAINNAGKDEAEGRLVVIVPPIILDITNITVSEGQQGTIRCQALGIPLPTITWRKWGLNKDLSNGDLGGKVRLIQSHNNILDLKISSMNNTETSNYTCYAYNKGGEVNRTGHFMVEHAPRFDPNHLKELYSWKGRTVNITCTAIADPPPIISWFHRNEQILHDNETYRLFPLYPGVSKISNLQVHVHEHHEWWVFGTYTCQAANKMGTGEVKIELHKADGKTRSSQASPLS